MKKMNSEKGDQPENPLEKPIWTLTEAYSESCQASKITNFQPLTIFTKNSILYAWQSSEYLSGWNNDFGVNIVQNMK